MNSEDLMRMKLETEKEYNRKQFGKDRIPRKPLSKAEKKSKRKIAQASQKRNRGSQ